MTVDARPHEVRPAPALMERVSRGLVLASVLLAFAAHVILLASTHWWLWAVTASVLVASFMLARWSFTAGLLPALLLAYTAPAVLALLTSVTQHEVIVVWLATVAGPLYAASDWRRWHVPGWWGIAAVAWALVLALSWPVIALREIDFSVIAAATLNTPNGLAAPPPPLSAASVVLTALGQLIGLLWLDLLWARFGARRLHDAERAIALPLLVSIAIASGVAIAQKTVDLTWLSAEPWPRLGRAAGTMLDANSFGTAAAVWATLALLVGRRVGWPAPAGAGIAALLGAGMWASGSRTALLIFAVGVLAIVLASVRRATTWRGRSLVLALVIVAGVALPFLATRSGDVSSPLARVMATIPASEEGGLSRLAYDLWDRNGYGAAANRALAQHPLTGVGVGAFPLLATDLFFMERGTIIPPDNAQNWWRHQLAELGAIGALPAMIVSAGILLMIVAGRARADLAWHVTLLRGALVGVGMAGLLGVGTQHPALFITFVTLVFWLGAALGLGSSSEPLPRAAWAGALAIAIAVVVGQAQSATAALRVPHRAVAHGFTYAYGVSEPETDAAHGTIRRIAAHAVAVVPAEHAFFRLTLVVPHASAASPVALKLRRNGTAIFDQQVTAPEPVVRYVAAAAGTRQLMLELDVAPPSDDGTGLMLAGTWFRDVPPGTDPALVVP